MKCSVTRKFSVLTVTVSLHFVLRLKQSESLDAGNTLQCVESTVKLLNSVNWWVYAFFVAFSLLLTFKRLIIISMFWSRFISPLIIFWLPEATQVIIGFITSLELLPCITTAKRSMFFTTSGIWWTTAELLSACDAWWSGFPSSAAKWK